MTLMGRTAYTTTQLMKLTQAKPVGILNHHDGRVWNIDAHLHNRSTYKNIYFPASKRFHNSVFFVGLHFTVKQSDFSMLKYSRIKTSVFGFNALYFVFGIVVNEAANNISLSAVGDFLINALI